MTSIKLRSDKFNYAMILMMMTPASTNENEPQVSKPCSQKVMKNSIASYQIDVNDPCLTHPNPAQNPKEPSKVITLLSSPSRSCAKLGTCPDL
jgi:hypothetical protein